MVRTAFYLSIGLMLAGPLRAGAEGWLLPPTPPLAVAGDGQAQGKGAVAGVVVAGRRPQSGPCGNFDRACLDSVVAQARQLSLADLKIFALACSNTYLRKAQQTMMAEDLGAGSFGRDTTQLMQPGGAYICKNVSKILKERTRVSAAP